MTGAHVNEVSIAGSVASAQPLRTRNSYLSLWIVLIDVIALELALALGCLSRLLLRPLFPIQLQTSQYVGLAFGVLLIPLAYCWVGLYPAYGIGAVQRLRCRVHATFMVFIMLVAWNQIFQGRQWSLGILIATTVYALFLPSIFEFFLRKLLLDNGVCGLSAVVLGANDMGETVIRRLQREQDLGLVPIALLDDDQSKWGTQVNGVPICGPISAVSTFKGRAKLAIVALPGVGNQQVVELVNQLAFQSVIVIPNLYGLQSLWTMSRDLGGILGLELRKNLLNTKNRIIKRTLDCAVALPAFLVTLPFLAICALLIKKVSPGSAFYKQEREGENGRPIKVWKLRTMYPDAEGLLKRHLDGSPSETENWLRFFKLKHDPRILPGVGSFLRKSSLDELPQLWNVLRGDMSLVGPRPFPYYHLKSFSSGFRALRSSVSPGLTGLWQVTDRSDGDLLVQEAQDTYYIRNWSLWLDLYVLLCTVKTVLFPKGAY